jgi:hypothetical protein
MVYEFSPEHYFAAHREGGEWVRSYIEDLVPPQSIIAGEKWAGVDSAVYIAIDLRRTVSYVGSVCRVDQQGLRGRMREHLKTPRGRSWVLISIIPLRRGTPSTQVRIIEGLVARVLNPHSLLRMPAA